MLILKKNYGSHLNSWLVSIEIIFWKWLFRRIIKLIKYWLLKYLACIDIMNGSTLDQYLKPGRSGRQSCPGIGHLRSAGPCLIHGTRAQDLWCCTRTPLRWHMTASMSTFNQPMVLRDRSTLSSVTNCLYRHGWNPLVTTSH